MIRWRSMVALAALVLTIAPARAEQKIAGEEFLDVATIPTDIEWVQTGGSWQADEKQGSYRVAVTVSGFEHLHRALFIQWIGEPKDVDEANDVDNRIIRTLEVKELGYVWTIEPRLKFTRSGELQIALDITRPDGLHDNGVREKRTVTAWPDGHYDFK
jgi:hypothetical protein